MTKLDVLKSQLARALKRFEEFYVKRKQPLCATRL